LKKLGSILFFLIASLNLFSQDVRFKHINKEDGLSQSRVNAILQDRDGFIWFGTDDGLNRFDGLKFTVYKNNVSRKSSLSDNWINCIFEDSDGRIWIGTSEGGLNRYEKFTNSFTVFQTNEKENSISHDNVTSIVQKDKDHLWIGTNDGLNLFTISTGKFILYKDEDIHSDHTTTIPNDAIKVLFKDKQGILWIGTDKSGLISFDSKNGKFKSWLKTNEDKSPTIEYTERVRAIFEDSKKRLWVGFQGADVALLNRETGELNFVRNRKNTEVDLESGVIQHFIEDHQGYIWIATAKGISIYNDQNGTFREISKMEDEAFSLKENHIRFLMEDKAHSIWCGTESSGISVYHRSLGKFNHVFSKSEKDFAPLSNTIFAFCEGKENDIWIATIGSGITKMNFVKNEKTHFTREKNLTHDNVLCFERSGDLIWFGTWGGGLGVVDLNTEKFSEPKIKTSNIGLSNNTIIDIEKDKNGNLWLATFNGLNFYDVKKDSCFAFTKSNGFPFSVIYSLLLDGDYIWVGTRGDGLIKLNVKTNQHEKFVKATGNQSSISDNTIHAIFKDGNYLWLSTKNGLSRMNLKNNTFKDYYDSDGLSSNFVLGVLKDKQNNLWVSTNNGITRFNPLNDKGKRFENRTYFAIDGLQSDEFNQNAFYLTSNGEMFFGGVNGFNHFHSEKIIDNAHIPPVFITSFKVFGKEFKLDTSIFYTQSIELTYRENFISFEFAALDYLLPEKNLYSYKMEGLDENWSEYSTRNYISYSDLAGGDYVFMVRATNNDGIENKEGVRIHIRVIPPFYKTKWFYAICIILILILIFVFIRLRIAGINREKKILEEKVEERTSELAEKNRDIMSSIEYAKRIQLAILPERKIIFNHFPDTFIYYQPKDIVSGDFYWFGVVNGKKILAVVDCTGHGVPGAFMSMIGHNLLNQIVLENKITDPSQILFQLNQLVKTALKQENKDHDTKDGMDVALCVIDSEKQELAFAGAFRPIYLIKGNSLEKIEGDKFPIGGGFNGEVLYTIHIRKLNKGDSFFIHSDGIVDQFGGPKGKKFMGKQLQALLIENNQLTMQELKALIIEKFSEWMGELEQVDDVLIIGVRI
jgi:ligand-binding sensor domain-containing protein/serine phosphatase RsbU (regulator of sigma subunit)